MPSFALVSARDDWERSEAPAPGILVLHHDPERLGWLVAEALVEATALVTARALGYCSGAVDVALHLDQVRAALVVEVHEARGLDPDTLLEPSFGSDGGPPRFDPGLSALESSFERLGGRILVLGSGPSWRFGLTLPTAASA